MKAEESETMKTCIQQRGSGILSVARIRATVLCDVDLMRLIALIDLRHVREIACKPRLWLLAFWSCKDLQKHL